MSERLCQICKVKKHSMAFIGHSLVCRVCSYDIRDRSSPNNSYKCSRKCLKCDKDFTSHLGKRLCPKCKKGT